MRHRHSLLFFLTLLCFPSYGYTQLWSGIIASSRATDWSLAGVQGGIPSASWPTCNNTACNNLMGAGAVTGATVQAAINGAQVNGVACSLTNRCVVQIRAGSFTTSGFSLRSGVAVRGAGADQTLFTFNAVAETNGDSCGYFYNAAIGLCGHPVTGTTANWTAGYSAGTTRITVSTRSGIVPGITVIMLNQLNETDGYPAIGDYFVCDDAGTCSSAGGGACRLGGAGECGRAPGQMVLATACVGGTCSGSGDVDISPPVVFPNFRSGQSPHALWKNDTLIAWSGVEDMSIDYSNANLDTGIENINAVNTWVKGVRIVYTGAKANFSIVAANNVFTTFEQNYIYNSSSVPQASYTVQCIACGAILHQNNILHGVGSEFISNGIFSNSVLAYNFSPGGNGPAYGRHGAGEGMNLLEGNVYKSIWNDVQEGTGHSMTAFRNAMIGNRYQNGGSSNIHSAFMLASHARFNNIVGNVIGDASLWTTYQGQTNGGCNTSSNMYDLGGTSCGGGSISADPRVAATLLRWGNWDEITSTAPTTNGDQTGTRWCGNSSNTGWTTICASTSEVPSGIANFPNPIPSTATLPASLYYAAKPTWWPAAKPWPAIGPDVSGGNITNLGGHAYTNPAADCYLTVMGGPANGSGGPLSFNAAACYGNSSGPTLNPPTGLSIGP
jgi:hypothetical protein